METYLPSDTPVIESSPGLFTASLETIAPGVSSLIADTRQSDESWSDALQRLLPVLAATWQQKQLLDVQVERARAGLRPLDVSEYAPGVKVGVTPETRNLLVVGGLVLAGIAIWGLARK